MPTRNGACKWKHFLFRPQNYSPVSALVVCKIKKEKYLLLFCFYVNLSLPPYTSFNATINRFYYQQISLTHIYSKVRQHVSAIYYRHLYGSLLYRRCVCVCVCECVYVYIWGTR
jgi:hypothetical protein